MTLRPATEGDRNLIENLFNLYRNDLNQYCGDFEFLDEDGYFEKGIADELLPFGDGVETFILCEGNKNLGLITVTDERYALEGCKWRFQELYLIRPARGRGLAHEAVRRLLKQKPGRWCLSVYKTNHPARKFWNSVIEEYGTLLLTMPGEEGMTEMVFEVGAKNQESR